MDKKEGKRKGNQNRGVYDYYAQYRQQVQQQYEQQRYEQQQYEQQVMAYGYPPPPHQQMNPDWQHQMYAMQQQMHPYETYRYQYPVQQMEGVPLPLPPGIPGLGGSTDPLEAVLGPFPCARLKNLPYDAPLEDILLLFQGLVVIDVVLVASGEAFVIFANPMDFQMALQRDRQPLGRQFVEISAASRDQYYTAIAKQHIQEQEVSRHIASSVGSSSIGRDDVVREDQQESATGALWTGATGSPNPSVIQSFGGASPYSTDSLVTSQQHLGASQQQQHGSSSSVMSGRGTSESSRPALPKRTGGGIQVGDHTGFLRMRGLPFSSAKEDIFHFFEGYSPVQESIVLTYRNDGRATGEAYIGFETPEDAKRAMELHRRMMGNRYIELFISNKEEQGRALARFGNR